MLAEIGPQLNFFSGLFIVQSSIKIFNYLSLKINQSETTCLAEYVLFSASILHLTNSLPNNLKTLLLH